MMSQAKKVPQQRRMFTSGLNVSGTRTCMRLAMPLVMNSRDLNGRSFTTKHNRSQYIDIARFHWLDENLKTGAVAGGPGGDRFGGRW